MFMKMMYSILSSVNKRITRVVAIKAAHLSEAVAFEFASTTPVEINKIISVVGAKKPLGMLMTCQ